MQKNPNKHDKPIKEAPEKRGKKKKGVTACSVKRRDREHCGICGSSDIVHHKIRYCEQCGEWVTDIHATRGMFSNELMPRLKKCGCTKENSYRGIKRIVESWKKTETLSECLACGAHEGPLCPNCKKPLWYKFSCEGGKKFCGGYSGCGFQNYIK